MRGSRACDVNESGITRSIPASAGQPNDGDNDGENGRVYPRECGAADTKAAHTSAMLGLSPRVRGSQVRHLLSLSVRGSIPASAGQPVQERKEKYGTKVYPRECGAAGKPKVRQRIRIGLSPRVRGSQIKASQRIPILRSIPASAGQPVSGKLPSQTNQVYPRECGAAFPALTPFLTP